MESNNREIERLGALFSGGRPAAALGKDCCYKNVSQLAKDVEVLQYEKIYLQKKLNGIVDQSNNSVFNLIKFIISNFRCGRSPT